MAEVPRFDDAYDRAVRIVPYDPSWPALFECEAAALRQALRSVAMRVDHVGSTAVPGLAAKPIIDIQISVASLAPMDAYRSPLESLGYLYQPGPDPEDDYPFFGKPPQRPRSYHVHLCQAGGDAERRHLAVVDFLRAQPAEAEAYGALKRRLAEERPGDRLAYIQGKEGVVRDLERRALDWAARGASTTR